ncbi:IS1595 family transposase ISBth19 [Sporomusa silvacetica DSM 10669]|uniref:IS1595 family transposase ISBth19 n=1 Tax=Sporomusa silvacetica DSM 10669 TaxID=1123289 RepID=A0ABZ3IHY8_9FIRM|nr:alpha/beta hydrolase [Sporomusa silvacetica]OZC14669.1 alpha/beta hydrolase family protein [Sporomusa silvacetica DSM 10669]
MIKENLKIGNIPAILWGEKSDKLFVVVHGNMSDKADDAIVVFAEEATVIGYQVLSFDLPEHGDRKVETYACKVQNCVQDLNSIMRYAQSLSNNISVFACSMGAYFSLLAYSHDPLKQCLFLSPVVNMERIINNMMIWFSISKNRLKTEKEVSTPIGQTLYWDYYCYVKEHPIVAWNNRTSILYGSEDNLCEFDVVSMFAERFDCDLQVMEHGEHYFHTEEQLQFLRQWLKKHIYVK